jgi:integrase
MPSEDELQALFIRWRDRARKVHVKLVASNAEKCVLALRSLLVPVPILAEALLEWRDRCRCHESVDWVFANEHHRGRHPYWGQALLRNVVRPIANEIGIKKRIGWHTFRHTYSTLLRSVGTEFKVMQELLRHSSLRSTMDIYTQAITPAKQAAQAAVITLLFSAEPAQRPADQTPTEGGCQHKR